MEGQENYSENYSVCCPVQLFHFQCNPFIMPSNLLCVLISNVNNGHVVLFRVVLVGHVLML
jgi:hypothetical protein